MLNRLRRLPVPCTRLIHASAIAALLLPLAGCGVERAVQSTLRRAVENKQSPEGSALDAAEVTALFPGVPDASAIELQKRIAADTPLDRLLPYNSGPGLAVVDPITHGSNSTIGDFGRGAAAWLHLVVAGQPSFGKSPSFSALDRAGREVLSGGKDLSLANAREIARRTGASHVAFGSLATAGAGYSLSYQIYDVNSGQPLGAPASVAGTQQQIVAGLPQLAQKLNRTLAGVSSRIPQATGLTAPDLSLIGRLRVGIDHLASANEQVTLARLSPHAPLAAFFYVTHTRIARETDVNAAVRSLLAQTSDNPVAMADLDTTMFDLGKIVAQVDHDFQSSPHNALYAQLDAKIHRVDFQSLKERVAAESAVRSAPDSPDMWLTLGYTIRGEADAVRHARVNDAMSSGEHSFINGLYPQWLHCAQNAVALDPEFTKGWLRTAQAASFDGDEAMAKTAFYKAISLGTDKSDVYSWGLEMFQPKWFGDYGKLKQVADIAAVSTYSDSSATLGIVEDLREAGLQTQSTTLLQSYMASAQKRIDSGIGVGEAHRDMAFCLNWQGNQRQAISEYRLAEQSLPNDPEVHALAGDVLDNLNDLPSAIKEYRTSLALDPDRALQHYDLGWDLKHQSQFAQAGQEFATALQLSPYLGEAHFALGEIDEVQKKIPQAIAEYNQALTQLGPTQEVYDRLIDLLDNSKQYKAALAAGKDTLIYFPDDVNAATNLSDVYLNLHNGAGASGLAQYALKLKPQDPYGHENLAEAYLQLGKIQQACDEWKAVVATGDPTLTPVAQKYLSQHGS